MPVGRQETEYRRQEFFCPALWLLKAQKSPLGALLFDLAKTFCYN